MSRIQTSRSRDASFADDIELLSDLPLPPLMIKVETRLGVANLPELIVAAAALQPTAVMIARGDLAVERGLQQMSDTQEQLLWLCEAAHIPVVWATQVLDGLLKTGIPSRGHGRRHGATRRVRQAEQGGVNCPDFLGGCFV